jgi:hypothetical protein
MGFKEMRQLQAAMMFLLQKDFKILEKCIILKSQNTIINTKPLGIEIFVLSSVFDGLPNKFV